MAANLLERDSFLQTLDDVLFQVEDGHGRIALVSGEAGIGKTSLVEHFLNQRQGEARVLWGTCEALFTPRVLGPLYDIAYQTQSSLQRLLEGEANRAALFAAVQDDLGRGPLRVILVIEDIHWADEATLDLITYLARRIHRLPALIILTYRNEELGNRHPLRLVLGDLPAGAVTRLHLPPLSEAAVATLASKAGRSAGELYAITNGNPFFLSETLASDAPGVPTSVSDAVLTQVARRSPEAQRLLELVAVVPTRVEVEVLQAAAGIAEEDAALEECLVSGLLRVENSAVSFRHELARQAVENALASARRRALHAEVLKYLRAHAQETVPLARLVHHAAEADDGTLVLHLAPEAARKASTQGAHREAAAYYRRALGYAGSLPAEARVELVDALATECFLNGQLEEAAQAWSAALVYWRAQGHQEKIGRVLRQLSFTYSIFFKSVEAESYGMEAVQILESLPPSRELARAYNNVTTLRMLQNDRANTELWGERAMKLAKQFDDVDTICSVLNDIGTAELADDDESGLEKLERSLQLALEHGLEEHAARAYCNLVGGTVGNRAYARAAGYIQPGLAYCADHDLVTWEHSMRADWARVRLSQGDWVGAEETATATLCNPGMLTFTRNPALLVLGLLRARRGDSGVEAALDEARDNALATNEALFISPTATARAEWRWLQGDYAGCADEAEKSFQLALAANYPWDWGEAAIWLWRVGRLHEIPARIPTPFALEMSGDWRGAAAAWEQLSCPYDRALALLGGDEAAWRTALAVFEGLGAQSAAAVARKRLRDSGVRGLPRGPRAATRENPLGLTPRQLEILKLLAEGLHNAEIAERLSTTPKTVEHHVSAVLAKLQARSRAEAVRLAYEQRLLLPAVALATTPG